MSAHWRRVGLLLLAGLATSGCLRPGFDRNAMLGAVADTAILPAHRQLVEEAEQLDAATRQFASAPTAEGLASLRAAWLSASLAWKGVEVYELPGTFLFHNAIEKRPARAAFIEDVIAQADPASLEAIDAAFIESVGSTSKGLAAIEYLIFESAEAEAPVLDRFADPARRAFVTALTANLAAKTEELHRFWAPEGGDYAGTFRANGAEGADMRGSISLLANQMIQLVEMVMRTRLGVPMGAVDGVPRPGEVESYPSGASLALMAASLGSIQRTLDAGLDDYLDYLDRSPADRKLSSAIRARLETVLGTLAGVPAPLSRAVTESPAEVEAAFESMRPLLVLIKTDLAALLGITVTFSDNDGD